MGGQTNLDYNSILKWENFNMIYISLKHPEYLSKNEEKIGFLVIFI